MRCIKSRNESLHQMPQKAHEMLVVVARILYYGCMNARSAVPLRHFGRQSGLRKQCHQK